MAHQLWGRPAFATVAAGKASGTLTQRRCDKERRHEIPTTPAAFDWDDLKTSGDTLLLRALRKWQIVDNPLRHRISNYALWRPYRDHLIKRAIDRFRSYEQIDTDRLHGMILAALMSRKVRYGEGTYGKLHRYAHLWLAKSELIKSEKSERCAA